MKICSKCKKEFSDDAIFCDVCGEKLECLKTEEKKDDVQFVFCPHCGAKVGAEYEFCSECGKSLTMEAVESMNESNKHRTNRMKGKKIGIGIAVMAVLCGIIGSVCVLNNRNTELTNQLLYLKKGGMYITDGTEDGICKVAKKVPMDSELAEYVTLQEKQKRMIYIDKVEYLWDTEGYSLYYRSLKDVE